MLSRVAGRVYWMSRYLERAENTARLVDVYGMMLLDLPDEADLGWSAVFQILGIEDEWGALGGPEDEERAVATLLSDPAKSYSLATALSNARENARTTRDLVPTEAWRTINELHMYTSDRLASEADRPDALQQVVERCHQVCGILDSTMSHGDVYQFVRLGRNLERADMISRMIDVAAAVLMVNRPELARFEDALWSVALRSLSAYQMYRQHMRRPLSGEDVIAFLLHNRDFPRSIVHCTDRMADALTRLPRGAEIAEHLASFAARAEAFQDHPLDTGRLHDEIDRFQQELAELNERITRTWLDPGRPS